MGVIVSEGYGDIHQKNDPVLEYFMLAEITLQIIAT